MPAATWPMTYSSSRRKSNHRCKCCNKVIKEGDAVLMARVVGKATRCMHEDCASKPYGGTAHPGRDYLEAWGMEYLAACGWKAAKAFLETSPMFRPTPTSQP